MFAFEVFAVEEVCGNGRRGRIDLKGLEGHFGDDLQGQRGFNSFRAGGPPDKWRVAMQSTAGISSGFSFPFPNRSTMTVPVSTS